MASVRSHHRNGSYVEGHYRGNRWVSGHHRSGTDVSPHAREKAAAKRARERRERLERFASQLAFQTQCWWCNKSVFFYRSESGGCALFDRMGSPWPIHSCWTMHCEAMKSHVAHDLADFQFNGRTYSQPRARASKHPSEYELQLTGFVDHTDLASTANLRFQSSRAANTIEFREIRFVAEADPKAYYALLVPATLLDAFPQYSMHDVNCVWLKHSSRWHLFAIADRRLNAGGRADRIAKDLISLSGVCYYCGDSLDQTNRWGFDTTCNLECCDCGETRRQMTTDEFTDYIKRCYRRIHKPR